MNERICVWVNTTLHNVGSFFIGDALLRLVAADKERIFDLDTDLTDDDIKVINDSRALIIQGADLYRKDSFPVHLSEELIEEIKVPIIPVGMGCRASNDSEFYEIDERPLRVIRKIHSKCTVGSVRDTHTYLNLKRNGIDNIILTGCPVLFHSLTLPPIKCGDKQQCIFIPQFYPLHQYNFFRRESNGLLQRIRRRTVGRLEKPVNDHIIHSIIKKNKSVSILTQQERDKTVVVAMGEGGRIIHWESAEDYKSALRKASYVFSYRLHSGMFAISYGVPVTFFGTDSRIKSFCNTIGINYVSFSQALTGGLPRKNTKYDRKFSLNRLNLANNMVRFFELNDIEVNAQFKAEVARCSRGLRGQ